MRFCFLGLKFELMVQNRILNVIKLVLACVLCSVFSGCAAAIFLLSLDFITNFRELHKALFFGLPVFSLIVVYLYEKADDDLQKGSSLITEALVDSKQKVPFLMAPLVFVASLLTHLGGGSAGREGTAVQMGGALADTLARKFKLSDEDRQTMLLCGISTGFAAVFGTPWAGAIFALEFTKQAQFKPIRILLIVSAAFLANEVALQFPVLHVHYQVSVLPDFNFQNTFYTGISGVLFGFTAIAYQQLTQFSNKQFTRIASPYGRVLVGAGTIVLAYVLLGSKYHGLGVPSITAAFQTVESPNTFALKILLTVITLTAGMKGGEVTPLFFIGATLGSSLAFILPLPVAYMAGLGFVSVFAGVSKTPIACIVLGLELFGLSLFFPLVLSCGLTFLITNRSETTFFFRNKK